MNRESLNSGKIFGVFIPMEERKRKLLYRASIWAIVQFFRHISFLFHQALSVSGKLLENIDKVLFRKASKICNRHYCM